MLLDLRVLGRRSAAAFSLESNKLLELHIPGAFILPEGEETRGGRRVAGDRPATAANRGSHGPRFHPGLQKPHGPSARSQADWISRSGCTNTHEKSREEERRSFVLRHRRNKSAVKQGWGVWTWTETAMPEDKRTKPVGTATAPCRYLLCGAALLGSRPVGLFNQSGWFNQPEGNADKRPRTFKFHLYSGQIDKEPFTRCERPAWSRGSLRPLHGENLWS